MTKEKKGAILKAESFDEILDIKYGKGDTAKCQEFEKRSQEFMKDELLKDEIARRLREARHEAHLTQEELARRAGTKKSYISKLENGRCEDMQLSTLRRIFEQGLGKSIKLLIA